MRERGSGKTPETVVKLLTEAVSKTSLLAVSKQTGLGIAAISRYIKGIGEPTQASLEKLATYFDVPVLFLRGDSFRFGGPNDEPTVFCAKCREPLEAIMKYFFEELPNGEKIEEAPVLEVWPCKNCCKENK
jgi:transcriptional regulator with XRE-family HTH domain